MVVWATPAEVASTISMNRSEASAPMKTVVAGLALYFVEFAVSGEPSPSSTLKWPLSMVTVCHSAQIRVPPVAALKMRKMIAWFTGALLP